MITKIFKLFKKNYQPLNIIKVLKGEKLGYDGTYTAKEDMLIGVLPIGYYDEVDRRLANICIFK